MYHNTLVPCSLSTIYPVYPVYLPYFLISYLLQHTLYPFD